MPKTELNVLTYSETLPAGANDSNALWSHLSAQAWQPAGSALSDASKSIHEHPLEWAAGAILAGGAIYLGATRLVPRFCSARNAIGAITEQSEVNFVAFRPKIMRPSAAAIAEMNVLPDSLPKSVTDVGMLTGLKFLPENLQGHVIGQATYGIAKAEVPLATNGLATCGALVVQCERSGFHYLAHLDSAVSPSQIRSSLSLFDLSQSRIFLMRGPTNYRVDAAVAEALRTTPGALQRLRFVEGVVDTSGYAHGIASYGGELYRFSPQMKTWKMFQTGQPTAAELRRLGLR